MEGQLVFVERNKIPFSLHYKEGISIYEESSFKMRYFETPCSYRMIGGTKIEPIMSLSKVKLLLSLLYFAMRSDA